MRKRNKKGCKTTCSKCNGDLEQNRIGVSRYCLSCANAVARATRKRHSELNPIQRMKANCRSYLNVYIRRGKIIPQPCEICNSTINIEAHHDDYTKPLDVKWLCRQHHLDHHNKNNREES